MEFPYFYSFILCKYTLLTTTKLALFLCTRKFQGKVYSALNEGSDYYRIYGEKDGTTKEYHHDIAFDELGDVLDLMIETGGMTKKEYQAKVKDFVCSHMFSFRNKTDLPSIL